MVACGQVAAISLSLSSDFAGASAVHADPLTEKGLQGTRVPVPGKEQCSDGNFYP